MRGFSVVEILVVIIIMAILLTLAVVNVRSTQINARDNERRTDVENMAMAFEAFYNSTHVTPTFPSITISKSYPTTDSLTVPVPPNWILPYLEQKTPKNSFYAPGADLNGPKSVIPATNNDTSPTGVLPQPTIDTYIYQPLTDDPFFPNSPDTLCTSFAPWVCSSYNIYYKLEAPTSDCPAPSNICVFRSKNR